MLILLLNKPATGGGRTGNSSVTLGAVTGAATGSAAIVGVSTRQIAAILQASAGATAATGNSSATLEAVVQSAVGAALVSGVSAATLSAALASAAGGVLVRADSARALEAILGAAAGVIGAQQRVGDSTVTLAIVTGAASGSIVADADVAVFFDTTEFARTVAWGGYTAQAIFDAPDSDVLGTAALSTEYDALLRSSQLPGIGRGATLTCGSATYRVREVRLLDDGKLKVLSLTRVSGQPVGDSGFAGEDLSAFFLTPDFAVTAVWNGQTGQVLLDTPTADILSGRAMSTEYTATCRDDQLVGIARGQNLAIAGVSYLVREVRAVGAGRIKVLTLSKP